MSTLAIPQASTTTWNIDPAHATTEFKVKHMMIATVQGQFSKVTGVLVHDESGPTKSRVEATIEAASIETHEPQRDTHLKSADFLHVEKFPTVSFTSSDIKVVGEGELKVDGDLTIRGVTRKVRFPVEGPTSPTNDPGAYPDRCLGDNQDQPERLRSDLERGTRDRWHSGARTR